MVGAGFGILRGGWRRFWHIDGSRKERKGTTQRALRINVIAREGPKKKNAKNAKMNENELSYKIIGAALEMHKLLGPGLLESAYETALAHDLIEIGLDVKRQVTMPFAYKDIEIEAGYRIDILVNDPCDY